MTVAAFDLDAWDRALLAEATRDRVFVFNIVAGAFGGPIPAPSPAEMPALIQHVAATLLASGCAVGFGDPDAEDFVVPEQLRVDPERLAESVGHFYACDPENAQFLVFARSKR